MKFIVVCGHCMHHDIDPSMEINFRDEALYHMCPNCKKQNRIVLKAEEIVSYAKSSTMRRR